MILVKIPTDPARRVNVEDGRWDEDEAAIAEAVAQGREIGDEEAAEMHKTILKACGDIIVWCALGADDARYDLKAHRHAVFEMREKFYTLLEDEEG